MLVEGSILYFTPFYFKNGSTVKNKYFLVIKEVDGDCILASLPSSQIYLPNRISETHGCKEVPEGCLNCYLFERGSVIGINGFSFPMLTAIYGQQIDLYEKELIEQQYPIEGTHYRVVDKLIKGEHIAILNCLRNSASVKKKYKNML